MYEMWSGGDAGVHPDCRVGGRAVLPARDLAGRTGWAEAKTEACTGETITAMTSHTYSCVKSEAEFAADSLKAEGTRAHANYRYSGWYLMVESEQPNDEIDRLVKHLAPSAKLIQRSSPSSKG